MIYLLRKHDIISVPFIREAYIICGADIIAEAISSGPQGTDIIVKNLFCQVDKRGFLHGGLEGIRTLDPYNANVVRSQLRYKPKYLQLNYTPFLLFVKGRLLADFSLSFWKTLCYNT